MTYEEKVILRMSIGHEVPMPNTAKLLNWQQETFYYWIDKGEGYPNCRYDLVCNPRKNRHIEGKISFHQIEHAYHTGWELNIEDIGKTIFPAPRMGELVRNIKKIPNVFFGFDSCNDFLVFTFRESENCIFPKERIEIPIQDDHFAEAYAQGYLWLLSEIQKMKGEKS